MSQNSSDSEGLVSVGIADVVSINPGVDKSRFQNDDLVPFVPMPAVEAGTGRIDVTEMRPFSRVKSGFTPFCSGDVLFAKITPCMENGKAAVVPQLEQQIGFGSTEFFVLRPAEGINPKYLYYFVSSSAFRHEAQHYMTGAVGQKRVPKRFMENEKIPLASTPRQNRIVEKIETLFTQLDKGEEALSAVQRQLQVYRQSVLKAAVTGELTRDWREANKDRLEPASELLDRILEIRRATWSGRGKYKQPSGPDISDLPDLPEGWVWASIDQLANVIGGLTKNRKRDAYPLRKPMLRVANVYQNRLELSDIHETGVTESEYERARLEDLDLLVVEGNGSKEQIGRMAVWRNEILNAVHQNHLIKVRMIEKRLVDFILHWFCSPFGRANVEKVASSTSGLYTLSISKVGALVAPVPSLDEAVVINERVVYAFDRILALDNWCEREIARSKSLRQSILKDAFSGRLVPQSPSDESASELLAHIKADNGVASAKKRRKAEA